MAVVPVPDPAATRKRLLDAAWRVLTRHGDQPLSLDAVAREAAVSKGGLLHHFPTRAALIDALYERWNDDFNAAATGRALADSRPGRWARAYLDVGSERAGPPAETTAELGFLAAVIADPERLRRLRERYETWQDRIVQDHLDPVAATLVRVAADGLWLADLLGLAPPVGELRGQLLAMLRDLATPGGSGTDPAAPGGIGTSPSQPSEPPAHRAPAPSPAAPA
ncbi:transcriptional regulator [Frankia sp. EI5c]|uniref:TetR/AcrR family transcriptional regulator n=1 Tax=Frankia sp. EI5c TaxID=683316 RepID=UPI0007C2AE9F|nr:TetR/AcrR family transcriptional regulator [Frankia sp. EI5c]OAA28824.1 transcriptional regulator [Frankia sp. EI5c]